MDHHVFSLANGIRVVVKPGSTEVAHACLLVHSGSRDEDDGKDGLAHLIEHLLFKRTERRSTNQILNRLEVVGGDLNAYTTKEYTSLHYASSLTLTVFFFWVLLVFLKARAFN